MKSPRRVEGPLRESIHVDTELCPSSLSIMQIQEGTSGHPVPPEHTKKADTELPAKSAGPSGQEEKQPMKQLEAGKKKSRIAFHMNDELDEFTTEELLGHSSGREDDERCQERTLQLLPLEREENDEDAKDDESLEERTSQLLSDNNPTTQLQKELTDYMKSLLTKGILDSQFWEIQKLQDESNPEFMAQMVNLFLTESKKRIKEISTALTEEIVNFDELDAFLLLQKNASEIIGAQRLKKTCIDFIILCGERNRQGCWKCLEQMAFENFVTSCKLKTLLKLEKQIVAAGGSMPKMKGLKK